jgi:hypothetical protein
MGHRTSGSRRVCACGCGRELTDRPNQRYYDGACRVRAHRSRTANQTNTAYIDAVWKARKTGAIDFYEAVGLLVQPSEAVTERLAVAA